MKIAIIDSTLHAEPIGGAQTILPKLLAGLSANGHEVHLIARAAPHPKIAGALAESGARLQTDWFDAESFVEEAAPELARRVNELAPDVFVVSVSPDIGWVVLPLLDPAIATVCIGHTDSETFYAPARHYRKFLTRAVGVSPEVGASYVVGCVIDEERVDWIPYGVTAAAAPPDGFGDRPLRLIFVGRFDETQKRISDLATVIRELSAAGVDYSFEIVGDGDEGERLRAAAADEIAAGRVVMRGWLEPGEVLAALRRSEIFVLTSAYEGFCIALVEAMANGCCPVVTDIRSGNAELVTDGENGFLYPVGDPRAMAAGIRGLASDRERLLTLRRRAYDTGAGYDVAKMVAKYEYCFGLAVADARANPRPSEPEFPLMPSCRSRFPLWLRRLRRRYAAAG